MSLVSQNHVLVLSRDLLVGLLTWNFENSMSWTWSTTAIISTDSFFQVNCQRCECCMHFNCQHRPRGNQCLTGMSWVSTTLQTKQSYCTLLHISNMFCMLSFDSQHSDVIPVSTLCCRVSFSSMIVPLVIYPPYVIWYQHCYIPLDNGPH